MSTSPRRRPRVHSVSARALLVALAKAGGYGGGMTSRVAYGPGRGLKKPRGPRAKAAFRDSENGVHVEADGVLSRFEAKPGQESYGERLRAIVRSETSGLVGTEGADLSAVEATVAAALSEAFETFSQFTPLGFTAEWRVDRSKSLDGGTLFGVMRIEPRRPR